MSKKNSSNSYTYYIYLEFLRVISSVAVVILHVAAQNFYKVDVATREWNIFNYVDSAVRWCVPVFVMISGAIFLDNTKNIDIKELYVKKIFRLIGACMLWSSVYAIDKLKNGADIKQTVTVFIKGEYHLWYLYMIIGIYILIPILRKMTEDMALVKYFLGVGFVFSFFIPRTINLLKCLDIPHTTTILKAITSANSNIQFHFTLGYVYYFVLGFYLSKLKIIKSWGMKCASLGMVGYLLTVNLTRWYCEKLGELSTMFYSNFSINVLMMSIAMFLFIKYTFSKINMTEKKINFLRMVSKHTFGIYLVHVFVLNKIRMHFDFNTLTIDPIVSIPLLAVGVFVISYCISVILSRIPRFGKYII